MGNTNCVEKPLANGLSKLGYVVGKYPLVFFILPMIISAGLGAGFYFLEDREANDIEEQFTPTNGPAKTERTYIKEHFPQSQEFSSLRLHTEGTYASFIAIIHKGNILGKFQDIVNLDNKIQLMQPVGSKHTFAGLCAKNNAKCASNSVVGILNEDFKKGNDILFPWHKGEFLGSVLGGVKIDSKDVVTNASAIRIFYYLQEDKKNETDQWLKMFIQLMSNQTNKDMAFSYFTSLSRAEEFEKSPDTVIPLFSITYFLAINISILSCMRLDCVRNKVWVATFGVLSAGLAVLTSFGLLLLCGMPFVMTVASSPFLILGIGVDDMFIMISCWQKTKVDAKVEDRMAETYKEAAVSITITTLTDVLAFYIGLMTPFRSVQSFCMYTSTAILFCYLYNITFFGAFLALNGRREGENRHWLTCKKVEWPDDEKKGNACSVGGAYDHETGAEEETPINILFKEYYGPFITKWYIKVFVVVLYAGYLAGSIYGCFQMQEGIDLKNLAPDDSYVASYYDNEDKYFSKYGPFVMLVIRDENFQYWDKCARANLNVCVKEFESSHRVAKNLTISWLDTYEQYANASGVNFTDEKEFMEKLPQFLERSGFKEDVNISKGKILTSRIFIPTANITTAIDEKEMLNFFRHIASTCWYKMELLVYHPAFIFFDQYAVIVSNTIQNIVVATAVMLVISLLLIPNPLCSLWVTFAIASVIVGVAGFMALWDVNLDSISMINLVICIGFSVDFSAHISYAFVSSEKKTANEKAIDALQNLGYPIIQGAVSTLAGVVVLSAAKSYIFRTFFKIMFLVILFGAVHGIMFIPVFLTFFWCSCDSDKDKQQRSDGTIIFNNATDNTMQGSGYMTPYSGLRASYPCNGSIIQSNAAGSTGQYNAAGNRMTHNGTGNTMQYNPSGGMRRYTPTHVEGQENVSYNDTSDSRLYSTSLRVSYNGSVMQSNVPGNTRQYIAAVDKRTYDGTGNIMQYNPSGDARQYTATHIEGQYNVPYNGTSGTTPHRAGLRVSYNGIEMQSNAPGDRRQYSAAGDRMTQYNPFGDA